MNTLEVTWWRATKVWWSLLWRGLLFVMLASIPLGFILGMTVAIFGVADQAQPFLRLFGALIGIPIGIWVVKIVLGKQFSDFRIVLLPSFESMLNEDATAGSLESENG